LKILRIWDKILGKKKYFFWKKMSQLSNESYRQMSCCLRFTLWCSGQYRCVVGHVSCIFKAEISYVLKMEAIYSLVIPVTSHRLTV